MFPLLQRYIFTEVLRVFTFVLGCITTLLMFVGVFQQATDRGLDALHALKILPYVIPSMLPFTIPSALLLTVSVVYGRLAGDQEITAAKTAGIHPVSLMWPAFLLGGVLSVVCILLVDRIIPWSIGRIEQHVVSVVEDIFIKRLETELQFSAPQFGLDVTVAGVDGKQLLHPVFRYARRNKVFVMTAERAIVDFDVVNRQAVIQAEGVYLEVPGGTGAYSPTYTETIRWEQELKQKKPQHLAIHEIEGEVGDLAVARRLSEQRKALDACFALSTADFPKLAKTQGKHADATRVQKSRFFRLNTEKHSRYALAFSCFFFSLLGTPFSMRFGKSQYFTSFLMCFVPIVCGYYPLMLGLVTQAKKGHVGPEWAMWVANGVLALCAWLVTRKVIRF